MIKKPIRKRGLGYIAITQPSYSALRNYFTGSVLRSILGHSRVEMRFGFTGEAPVIPNGITINSVEGIKNAVDKISMKEKFKELEIPSPGFYLIDQVPENVRFPLYGKLQYRSRGNGMVLIQNKEKLEEIIAYRTSDIERFNSNNYYFELKSSYTREYGVHISSSGGIFHAVRKMLKTEADERWFRNSLNCVFYLPENEQFEMPSCWENIEEAGKKYLLNTGLDIGRFDVQVNRDGTRFRFIEVNSSSSIYADIIFEKYKEEITNILISKK
tara:strand:+ start:10645 stop:11457 length:813 start_codon:yes stop_codon:yes gene_type:complete